LRWRDWLASLPAHVSPVAVVYADHEAAQSPDEFAVLDAAQEFGVRWALVDTWSKQRGGLVSHWNAQRLMRFVQGAAERSMSWVAAGSLTLAEAPRMIALGAGYIAVRGAVCRGERTAKLDVELVRQFAEVLSPGARVIVTG
jgi:uncharacterized protein (UPF0264 family)